MDAKFVLEWDDVEMIESEPLSVEETKEQWRNNGFPH